MSESIVDRLCLTNKNCVCPCTFSTKPFSCYGSCSYVITVVIHACSIPSSTEVDKEIFMRAGYILKLARVKIQEWK